MGQWRALLLFGAVAMTHNGEERPVSKRVMSSDSSIQDANNPHALASAQDDAEVFEVMHPPPNDFDIYHDVPPSTGATKERKLVHRDQDWHCSTHVWLVDISRKQILLQKRSPQKDTFPNRCDISAAGHIEAGADPRETAVREVAEELGLHISADTLEYSFTCPANQAPWGGCNAYEHVYFLPISAKECKFAIGSAEVTSVKWMSIGELMTAWERNDTEYVPRVERYQEAFIACLSQMNTGSSDRRKNE